MSVLLAPGIIAYPAYGLADYLRVLFPGITFDADAMVWLSWPSDRRLPGAHRAVIDQLGFLAVEWPLLA